MRIKTLVLQLNIEYLLSITQNTIRVLINIDNITIKLSPVEIEIVIENHAFVKYIQYACTYFKRLYDNIMHAWAGIGQDNNCYVIL